MQVLSYSAKVRESVLKDYTRTFAEFPGHSRTFKESFSPRKFAERFLAKVPVRLPFIWQVILVLDENMEQLSRNFIVKF